MALSPTAWTLADLARLPDDGNKYELVDGALFVTPAPSTAHEQLTSVLHAIVSPYVRAARLGLVHTPRAVVRHSGSEVEPDLMVRPGRADLIADTVLVWHPAGAGTALHLDVVAYFAEALG